MIGAKRLRPAPESSIVTEAVTPQLPRRRAADGRQVHQPTGMKIDGASVGGDAQVPVEHLEQAGTAAVCSVRTWPASNEKSTTRAPSA
jgi:hypothetical protein